MRVNDLASCIHQILYSTCYGHLLCGCLLRFYHSIVNFIISFDFNQLVGPIRHFCQEVRIVLADSARFRVIIMHGKISLIGGKHSCEVYFFDFSTGDILHKTFFLWDRIEAVGISMETFLDLVRGKAGITICNDQVILCRKFVISSFFGFTQQDQLFILRFQFRRDIKERMKHAWDNVVIQNCIIAVDCIQDHICAIYGFPQDLCRKDTGNVQVYSFNRWLITWRLSPQKILLIQPFCSFP